LQGEFAYNYFGRYHLIMGEGGPSTVELGINKKDRGLETAKKTSPVELPSTSHIYSEETISSSGKNEKEIQTIPSIFTREQSLPEQAHFSPQIQNEILVPVRGELRNGNLANFLRQLNRQKGFHQEKLGVVMLINDNAKDQREGKVILDENRLTIQYLSLLSTKDIKGIEQLNVPEEYKDLAKEIVEKNKLELRFDYLHSEKDSAHFGELRLHLFKLAETFRNRQVPPENIVLQLSDIDTHFSSSHFRTLQEFYKEPSHLANFMEQDFMPGVHEDKKQDDISRDLLLYLDDFRRYRYAADIKDFLSGSIASGTPIISGRLSYFSNEQMNNSLVKQLSRWSSGEDYAIGNLVRGDNTHHFGHEIGNVGEVYREHRARTPKTTFGRISEDTDAEEAFNKVTAIKEGDPLLDNRVHLDTDYIEQVEQQVALAKNHTNPEDTHTDNFKESDEYRKLLMSELKKEQIKVRLRRMRLVDYIDSLASGERLPDNEHQIIDPYIEYFQDETDAMKQQLAEGKSPEQVAVSYIQKYDSFFNPDTPIHTDIARLRALKKYTYAHNLTLR